jgi:hypothetical protein
MTGADRAEVLGVVGLELDRLGKKEESARALTEALVPYEEPKTKDDKKPRERPPLRAPVVALARLHGKPPPPPGKSLEDQENSAVGEADALARQGKLDEARALARTVPVQGGGRLRLLIAVAAAAHESKVSNDEVQPALDAVSSGSRPELSWPLLRLVEVGLAAGTSPDKLESAIAAIVDPNLAAWARLQMLRKQLASSRAVEPAELLDKIPPATAAGMLARLELSRHNLRRDSGWASTVRSWDDGPRALGSLGVALGLQGSK